MEDYYGQLSLCRRCADNQLCSFYNFGDSGQSEIDNIVSGYTYKDVIVPQTIYLKDGSALAFRDNGFSVYQEKTFRKKRKMWK